MSESMTEARRGCGWRKVGGLYLMGEKGGIACCKLPIPLPKHFCPVCGLDHTVHQTRGWSWMDPRPLIESKMCTNVEPATAGDGFHQVFYCPAMDPAQMGDKVGLLGIGAQFYPTSTAFLFEAERMGISRRIANVPRGFRLGETWVFLAHPKTIRRPGVSMTVTITGLDGKVDLLDEGEEEELWTPGIFRIFKPTAIEKIVTAEEYADAEAMTKLRERDITPVVLPDDKKHTGTVYDADQGELPIEGDAVSEDGE